MYLFKKSFNLTVWLHSENIKLLTKFTGLTILYQSIILWIIFLFKYYNSKLLLSQSFFNPYYLLIRWDSEHFLKIVASGYDKIEITFFPLYPLLVKIIGLLLSDSYILAGFLISWSCLILSLFYLYKLLILDNTLEITKRTLLLFLFSPFAIFFSIIYTESLFIFLSIAFFYYLKRDKWLIASIFGGFAMVTRNVGIFLLVIYIIKYFRVYRFKLNKKLLFLLIMVSGLAVFCWYGFYKFNDWLAFISASKYWSQWRTFIWPWQHRDIYNFFTINFGFFKLYDSFGIIIIEFGSFLLSLIAGIYFVIKKNLLYGIYCLLNTLLFSFFSSFYGVNRFIIVIFPIYLFFAKITEKHKMIFYYLLAISIVFFVFNVYRLSSGGWLG